MVTNVSVLSLLMILAGLALCVVVVAAIVIGVVFLVRANNKNH
jgi:hypothetical protein